LRTAIISREELVRRIQGLPPLPQTMMRVWQVIDNPTSNARTLADAICADPSLVASLLKLANSASYGRSRTIQAIPEAITLMGFNVIKKMCMGVVCREGLLSQGRSGGQFDRVLFWRHCVGTGLASEALAETLRLPIGEVAFSHGLLHDIGLLALDRCLPEELDEVLRVRAGTERNFMEVEAELLGMNHADVGAALVAHWNLPESLHAVIEHHGRPRREAGSELETIVHLGCVLTDQQEYCQCGEIDREFEASRRFLGLTHEQVSRARGTVMSRLVALAEAFEI